MLKDNIVTKANDLNVRAYRLNRIEQLIVLSIASMVQPDDEDFKTYKLSIKEFIDLLQLKGQSKYCDLPKVTKNLMTKVIEIKRHHSLLQVCWFSSVEHIPGKGIIEFEFSPKLKPYLLNLKENFVTYALKQVATLTSKYSIRIYELLKQYLYKKTIQFTLEDFRLLIGVEDDKYPLYNNLKQRVIKVAQKELKEKTDISFDFEEIKTGRKVTSIKFYIKSKVKSEIAATEVAIPEEVSLDEDIKTVKAIIQEAITDQEAQKILNTAAGSIEKIKEKYLVVSKLSNVHNIVGAMITAIKENWIIKSKNKVSAWSYSGQRQYDFRELEKKLSGWKNSDDKI